MATVMKWILALLACALPCMGQLTLQNAHYPTLFKSAGSSLPPVSGYVLWLAPEGAVFEDNNAVTNGVAYGPIRRWNDLSGYGNHAYRITELQWAGANFDPGYTLNGLRIMQFGRNTNAGANANKTGLATSNNITLIGGFTLFWVGSFLPSTVIQESAGAFFGYNNFELLARRSQFGADLVRTYHNAGGVELADPVTIGNSNYQVYAWTFNDTANTTALYRSNNIIASATDNGATPAAGRVSVGYRADDAVNSHINAGIPEMILYTNALSATEISNVNVYLKNKYGL